MSEGPPEGYNPIPSDHLNFANQTRTYRKDRAIRALGMSGIPTGGTSRPLYGLGQMTEEIILAASKRKQPRNPVEKMQQRAGVESQGDGSAVLKSPNRPDKQIKHKEPTSQEPKFGVVPGSPAAILRDVKNWGESVKA